MYRWLKFLIQPSFVGFPRRGSTDEEVDQGWELGIWEPYTLSRVCHY